MICHSRLLGLLSYDRETGKFTWLVRPRKNTPAGSIAGSVKTNGYIKITINGRSFQAHRLAWFYMHGEWPPPTEEMDHINRIRSDNRAVNLRVATRSQNKANSKRPAHNTSGFKGVSWNKVMSKWLAQIDVNRRNINLGYFDDPQEAHAAYCRAAAEYHGEFARTE